MNNIDTEKAARLYCAAKNEDPDERISYPDPNGYAVARYKPRWEVYQTSFDDLVLKIKCIVESEIL